MAKEDIPVRKIHDLVALLQDCLPRHPLWEEMKPDLERLLQMAVKVRYPGESATGEQAKGAIQMMKRCRDEIRIGLALPTEKHPKRRRKR